jgi:Domain of Unknown Function (DUF1080)
MKRNCVCLMLALLAVPLTAPALVAGPPKAKAADAKKEQWVPLFNGKDLSGWSDALDNASDWQVVNGLLEGRGGGRGAPAVLVTERQDFKNFTLQVKLGFKKPGGGGIELRRGG